VEAPARAAGLPRAVRVTCATACLVEVRLVAPASAVTAVAARRPGGLLLARVRRVVGAGASTPLLLRPTPAGARLVGTAAPGRLAGRLEVRARDAAGPLGSVTRAVAIGPDRPWPHVVGRSVHGRPIVALLSSSPAPLLVVGAIHGDEPGSAQVLRAALTRVPAARLRAVVVTVANPDGYAGRRRHNARGVDLNRNFPARDWGGPGAVRPGARPASEPEAGALVDLVAAQRPRRLVALHQPLAVVLGTRRDPFTATLAARTGLPVRASVGYPTPGSMATWARARGVAAHTVELPGGAPSPRVVAAMARLLRGSPAP